VTTTINYSQDAADSDSDSGPGPDSHSHSHSQPTANSQQPKEKPTMMTRDERVISQVTDESKKI